MYFSQQCYDLRNLVNKTMSSGGHGYRGITQHGYSGGWVTSRRLDDETVPSARHPALHCFHTDTAETAPNFPTLLELTDESNVLLNVYAWSRGTDSGAPEFCASCSSNCKILVIDSFFDIQK